MFLLLAVMQVYTLVGHALGVILGLIPVSGCCSQGYIGIM